MRWEVVWCDPGVEHFFRREFANEVEANAAITVAAGFYYVCHSRPCNGGGPSDG